MTTESEPRFCPSCGNPLYHGAGFCPKCGTQVFADGSFIARKISDAHAVESPGPVTASTPGRLRVNPILALLILVAVIAAGGFGASRVLNGTPAPTATQPPSQALTPTPTPTPPSASDIPSPTPVYTLGLGDCYRPGVGVLQPGQPTCPPTNAPPVAPTDTPEPKPVVLVTFTGTGSHNTKSFTLSDNNDGFDVRWTYDCRAFGGTGNFIVHVVQGDETDFLLNELSSHGSGTDTEYDISGGTMHFEVISECRWTLKVIGYR